MNVFKFINTLKTDEVITKKKVVEAAEASSKGTKKKYDDVTSRLENIVQRYDQYDDKLEYLRAIAYNFNLQV